MGTFSTINKAPGVYIQEITIPGPIPGVSTSNTAFVGPAAQGPLLRPTRITDISQFWAIFGDYVDDPYRVYAAHAVNGFFAEGGQLCYFVRVGTGKQAWLGLQDRSGKNRTALIVTAFAEGVAGNAITVKVDDASIANTTAQKATADIAAGKAPTNQRTVGTASDADAANFRPGDAVWLASGGNSQRATISSISKDTVAHTTTFTMVANLTNDYGGGKIRVADLIPGQTRFRATAVAGLEPGTYINLTQGAVTEDAVVKLVDQINNFVTLGSSLTKTYPMDGASPNVAIASKEFTLTITAPGNPIETFANLSLEPSHSRYFGTLVTSASVSVNLADPPTTTPPSKNLPVALAAPGNLANGADEDIKALQPKHYHDGIDALQKIDDVNLLCVPDAVGPVSSPHFQLADTQDIQAYMIAHCEKMKDRFAILDCAEPDPTDITFTGVTNQRQNMNSDNGYGALYFPWIGISNPFGKGKIYVPPSGHTAGVYANSDSTFAVFRAPANEQITSALAVDATLTDAEQGPLNEQGINVIRAFPNQGIKIWGARTITPPSITAWRFINVRRLLIFIEKSIQEATRFAVFLPNNLALWHQIKRLVNGFLTEQWNEGALFGDTPEQAFRVRVDEIINPPEITALGQLIVQVTVRATTPAEFIVFEVIQDITGSTLQEKTS